MNNSLINPRAQMGCLASLVIGVLVVSYLATASVNPFAIYASNNLWAKIIGSVLLVLLLATLVSFLLQQISLYILYKSIEIKTSQKIEDVICPGCGHPLIQFMDVYGLPIVCSTTTCKTAWHDGPACYNKGMAKPKIRFPIYPCPLCREAASSNQDLFDKDLVSSL